MHIRNKQYVDELQNAFAKSGLADRIVSLIYHGSSMYKALGLDPSTDIDLELILSEPKPEDYGEIYSICHQLDVPIECQVRYLAELQGEHSVIGATSYKIFMWFAYANGILLLGKENIFQTLISTITSDQIDTGLLICIQLAYKDIRKTFLAGRLAAALKNVRVFLFDLLLFKKVFEIRNLGSFEMYVAGEKWYLNEVEAVFPGLLTTEEKNLLMALSENNFPEDAFPELMRVMDTLYFYIV